MICVDSSAAVKWLLREQHFQQARALLREQLEQQEGIVAPTLLPMEIANILRQRIRAGTLTPRPATSPATAHQASRPSSHLLR